MDWPLNLTVSPPQLSLNQRGAYTDGRVRIKITALCSCLGSEKLKKMQGM